MSTGPMSPEGRDQPGSPPPAPERSGDRMPMLLASLALVLAVVAAGVSLVALSRTGTSAAAASAASSTPTAPATDTTPAAPTPADSLPSDATATTEPSAESTTEPTDGPDPAGVYTVAYTAEPMRLQPSDRDIDLDAPSGNANPAAAELLYGGFPPETKMQFRGVALASVNSPSATANDCVERLRRAPIDLSFTPSKGQLVCVLTDRDLADNQGIRQKVVLVKVDSVGADGTLNLTLTAWNVPR
jgi:hypothetical protein